MSTKGLRGAAAIVTGGSAGYGVGIARVLKERGARVWITGRRAVKLEAVARDLGVSAVCVDVSGPGDWDRVVETVTATADRVDILVNNAGAGLHIAPYELGQLVAQFCGLPDHLVIPTMVVLPMVQEIIPF